MLLRKAGLVSNMIEECGHWLVLFGVVLLFSFQCSCDSCIATLWYADPLRHAISLPYGYDSMFYYSYYPYNRGADLGLLPTLDLIVAPQGFSCSTFFEPIYTETQRIGTCIDIGTMQDLYAQYVTNLTLPMPLEAMYTTLHWKKTKNTTLVAFVKSYL